MSLNNSPSKLPAYGECNGTKEITYGVVEEHYVLYGQERISYGLVGYTDTDLYGTAMIVASIRDVTPEQEQLTALAGLCNRLELSLVHLADVVEDFLAEQSVLS